MEWVRLRRLACAFGVLIATHVTAARTAGARESGGTFVQRTLWFGEQSFRYSVFVPAEPGPAPPILLYLHGAGGIGSDGTAQLGSGLAAALRHEPNRFATIVVFPQASERWVTPRMERLALEALERSSSEFHADRQRTYLMGFSVGGAGAWRLAYLHPHRFAALVVIAGTVRSAPRLFTVREYAADERTHAYLHASDPFLALALRLRGLPIAVYHGSCDSVVSPSESRRVVSALRSQSSNVRFTEYPGVDHTGALKNVLVDRTLFPWLLSQVRSVTP